VHGRDLRRLTGLELLAFKFECREAAACVYLPEALGGHRQAGQHARLLCNEFAPAFQGGGDGQARGDVTGADVLGQCPGNRLPHYKFGILRISHCYLIAVIRLPSPTCTTFILLLRASSSVIWT